MDEQRKEELAAITPADVTDFMDRLAFFRSSEMMPTWVTTHEYPVADGRVLGLARRSLEAMLSWKPDGEAAADIKALIDLIARALKTAVVANERVRFRFTGAELLQLRPAVALLAQYDLTKQRDARQGNRRYPKGRN